eukprot:TRINITY_DN3939_c0_g1_i2.p1 TRINITY_DN3939_c0_g1~~TRINITY_DN3939_c0_g1_i2.p1  ORF type:complete len:245 (-),score=13.33 TRINITY_DN3939_c0_g1_i2:156-815(-)
MGNAVDIAEWVKKTQLPSLPDMVFGSNNVKFLHNSGLSIHFNAVDALCEVDHSKGPHIKVKPHAVWSTGSKEQLAKLKESGESDVEILPGKEYDWTFSTKYKGSLAKGQVESTEETINISLLTRPEPILFYSETHLYEDELADNGTAQLSAKVRVMPSCFFFLQRFFLRVDGVLFRVFETRLFHEFGKNYLIREWLHKEDTYDQIKSVCDDNVILFLPL